MLIVHINSYALRGESQALDHIIHFLSVNSASFAEFYLDFMGQQFLAETFAPDFQSYYYNRTQGVGR